MNGCARKKQATRGILLLLWVKVNAVGIAGCTSFPCLSLLCFYNCAYHSCTHSKYPWIRNLFKKWTCRYSSITSACMFQCFIPIQPSIFLIGVLGVVGKGWGVGDCQNVLLYIWINHKLGSNVREKPKGVLPVRTEDWSRRAPLGREIWTMFYIRESQRTRQLPSQFARGRGEEVCDLNKLMDHFVVKLVYNFLGVPKRFSECRTHVLFISAG